MANEDVRFITDAWMEDSSGFNASGFCVVGNWGGDSAKGALRFTNIQIPKNASLNLAQLIYKYSSVGDTSGSWKFKVNAIDEDNTASFGYPFGRPTTSAQNNYDEGPPTSGGTKTIDVRSMIQEVVARGGWSQGNALGFILEDQGSSNNIYAFANLSTSYLVYRINAEPDFTPTPTTVSAPSIPGTDDFGIKISEPGKSVFTATELELYFTTRKKQFKVVTEGQLTTTANPHSITHGLGYVPFSEVFAKSGSYWYRLPFMNFSGGSNVGYMEADDTYIKIYTSVGRVIYYYVFLDELAT